MILPRGTKGKVKAYLLDILEEEDPTRFKKATISEIRRVALEEKFYGNPIYYNCNTWCAIRDWFQGLGMNVEYTYHDIANRMRLWGYTVSETDDDDYYTKCDLYWNVLAEVVNRGR